MVKNLKLQQGQRTSFHFAHWLFGRCLGMVSLIAFLSYWSQSEALIGDNGLNPWKEDLLQVDSFIESNDIQRSKFNLRPTLLWFSSFSNHHLLFTLGSISSLALALGFMPRVSACLIWIFYLSLSVVGEPFLSFQWDTLLLESLFISLPYLPFSRFHRISEVHPHSKWARILVILLLTKLMLESGLVKFSYFDIDQSNAWIDYTALNYHYWTQPLPHALSPFVHSLPQWFDEVSLSSMFFIEIALPFCFFLPTLIRRFALLGQVLLQIAIILSGNYGFFNLLTLTLCIPLIDDGMMPERIRSRFKELTVSKSTFRKSFHISHLAILYFLFLSTSWIYFRNDFKGNQVEEKPIGNPQWLINIQNYIQPIRSINSYGLFRVMTKTRPEILIEGSSNGEDWKLYEFKWKPDHPSDLPKWAGFHMPRIDWQMWFEGLRAERYLTQPFPRFLYTRFLEIIANGGGQKECFNLNLVLGQKEMQAFSQSTPEQKKIILTNFENLMRVFLQQSSWFGKLLQACLEQNQIILSELDSIPFLNEDELKPQFLRISLAHYQFKDDQNSIQPNVWKEIRIPNTTIQIKKK